VNSSCLCTFQAEVVKHELKLISAFDTLTENLRADVEHDVEKHSKLLLSFFCQTFIRTIGYSLDLSQDFELV